MRMIVSPAQKSQAVDDLATQALLGFWSDSILRESKGEAAYRTTRYKTWNEHWCAVLAKLRTLDIASAQKKAALIIESRRAAGLGELKCGERKRKSRAN